MKVAIASDHAGFKLKTRIIEKLKSLGYEMLDKGTYSSESCDYPDYIKLAAYSVRDGEADRGIVICGSGIGASIVANKVKGIRAALCHNVYTAFYSRRHNDANVIALGARLIDFLDAIPMIQTFLTTNFEGDRHIRRIEKMMALERE